MWQPWPIQILYNYVYYYIFLYILWALVGIIIIRLSDINNIFLKIYKFFTTNIHEDTTNLLYTTLAAGETDKSFQTFNPFATRSIQYKTF